MRTPPILFDGIDALEDLVNAGHDVFPRPLTSWSVVEEFFQCAAVEIDAEHDYLAFGFEIDAPGFE